MAKGNMLLGMARGKVGDIVLQRRNGEQVVRPRVRKIANPKSAGQIYQRALMLTVLRAYQQGKEIFDHSFQGLKVPEGNYRRFLKVNLGLLRQRLVADVRQGKLAEECTVAMVAPGAQLTVPNALRVSEGSLVNDIFVVKEGEEKFQFSTPTPVTGETFGTWLQRYGLRVGDIFTFVLLGDSFTDATFDEMPEGATSFDWVRLVVKDIPVTTVLDEALYSTVFEISSSKVVSIGDLELSEPDIPLKSLGVEVSSTWSGGAACIRSREDSKLRSTETLHFVRSGVPSGYAPTGITAPWILDRWREGGSLGNSDLILEGGEI